MEDGFTEVLDQVKNFIYLTEYLQQFSMVMKAEVCMLNGQKNNLRKLIMIIRSGFNES